jgi:hypothetical protein
LKAKPFVRSPKLDPPGAQGRFSILNVDLVAVAAAVELPAGNRRCLGGLNGPPPAARLAANLAAKLPFRSHFGSSCIPPSSLLAPVSRSTSATMAGSDTATSLSPVRVLELKFQIFGGDEATCWCGTRKPFGELFRHLIVVLKLPACNFYYGGTKADPTMGVVVHYDSCPHDLMISNLERIDIVPTRPRPFLRPPPLASEPEATPEATTSSASSAVHVPQRRGPRTPSRSPRQTLARTAAAPKARPSARPAQVGTTEDAEDMESQPLGDEWVSTSP